MRFLTLNELDELTPKHLVKYLVKLKSYREVLKEQYKNTGTQALQVKRRLAICLSEMEASVANTEVFRTEQIPREAFISLGDDVFIFTYLDDDLNIN